MLAFHSSQTAGAAVPSAKLRAVVAAGRRRFPRLRRVPVTVSIVGSAAMRRLNGVYHGSATVTDVLSFRYPPTPDQPTGSIEIIICYPRAVTQARRATWRLTDEIQLLVAHGLLHAAGFDDRTAAQVTRMRVQEAAIIAAVAGRRPLRLAQ